MSNGKAPGGSGQSDACREAFEAWAKKVGFDISREHTEKLYMWKGTGWEWEVWQAAWVSKLESTQRRDEAAR